MDPEEKALEEKKLELENRKFKRDGVGLFISFLTPAAIAGVGFMIQAAVSRTEHEWKSGERRAEQRERIYANLGPDLNVIYCYVNEVGDYTAHTPVEIIEKKRTADRTFHTYYGYWSPATKAIYSGFMTNSFETYAGVAKDAKIRAFTYQKEQAKNWQPNWAASFSEASEVTVKGINDPVYRDLYLSLVNSFLNDLASNDVLSPIKNAQPPSAK